MSQHVSKSYLRHPTTTPESTNFDFFIHETDFFALVVLCYRNVNKQTKVCENNSGIIHSLLLVITAKIIERKL
jgi:hypothetical protein